MRREAMTPGEAKLERRLLWELWVECLPWYRRWVARIFGP